MSLDNSALSRETASMNTTDYCKRTITSGRYTGRVCVNALPCRDPEHAKIEEEIKAIAYNLQARGPDEFPYGFYLHVATDLHKNGVRANNPEEK